MIATEPANRGSNLFLSLGSTAREYTESGNLSQPLRGKDPPERCPTCSKISPPLRGRNLEKKLKTIRTDVVGSLLRPAELLDARRLFDHGALTSDDLSFAENKAIRKAIELSCRWA